MNKVLLVIVGYLRQNSKQLVYSQPILYYCSISAKLTFTLTKIMTTFLSRNAKIVHQNNLDLTSGGFK